MIFQSDRINVSSVADAERTRTERVQIYALSVRDLQLSVERVQHRWFRRESGRLTPAQLADGGMSANEELLNRPITSLSSDKMPPHLYQLSWQELSSFEYRTRSTPRIFVLESEAHRLESLATPPPVIKNAYCMVAGMICREEYFVNRWKQEGLLKDAANEKYILDLRQYELELAAWEALSAWERDPENKPKRPPRPTGFEREPHLESITKYYLSHKRKWLVALLRANQWEDDPLSNPALTPDQAQCYHRLNKVFSGIDLGRNSYMRFAKDPGPRTKYPTPKDQ